MYVYVRTYMRTNFRTLRQRIEQANFFLPPVRCFGLACIRMYVYMYACMYVYICMYVSEVWLLGTFMCKGIHV